MVPTIGAVGAEGATCMITSAEARDIHPAALVTVKLYVPGLRFAMVAVVPVPDIAPGLMIHVPVAGRPFSTTLPNVDIHEAGCVTVPTIGAVGATGARLMTTVADSTDIHPGSLVTLKV
jgi:protein involved in polysaccharide export with SLBB domain